MYHTFQTDLKKQNKNWYLKPLNWTTESQKQMCLKPLNLQWVTPHVLVLWWDPCSLETNAMKRWDRGGEEGQETGDKEGRWVLVRLERARNCNFWGCQEGEWSHRWAIMAEIWLSWGHGKMEETPRFWTFEGLGWGPCVVSCLHGDNLWSCCTGAASSQTAATFPSSAVPAGTRSSQLGWVTTGLLYRRGEPGGSWALHLSIQPFYFISSYIQFFLIW